MLKEETPLVCLGYRETEGKCTKKAGTKWSPYWCEECNKKRLDHISNQLEKLKI